MALTYNITPADDWDIFDFGESVTYYIGGTSPALPAQAIRRPISQSQGRRIEQFDIGDGLNQMDLAFHIAATNELEHFTITPFNFATLTENDHIEDGNGVEYDVIFAEYQVDNSKIFCVIRKRPWGSQLVAQIANAFPWWGKIYAAHGDGNPNVALQLATSAGVVSPTPTNISTTVARCAYFRLPEAITVNRIRYYGVATVAGDIYRVAIYNAETLARLTAEHAFSTTAATWGAAASSLGLDLAAGQLYLIACAVNTTGTTAGVLACQPTTAATTGTIGVLPKSWPGNLDLDTDNVAHAFAQFSVTAGALPNPAATIAAPAGWTGGMPLFFLDNNDT
jgi:hypothetical protein